MKWKPKKGNEHRADENLRSRSLPASAVESEAGPLIRAYVLREGDTIKDMMFTSTTHTTPADALEKLEQQLIGLEIDENTIRQVKKWATKDIQIGMLESSQIAEEVIGTYKQSYEKA